MACCFLPDCKWNDGVTNVGSDDSDMINPILDKILKNKKVKWLTETNSLFIQYKEQVEEWKKLLAEKDPWIEEEKFVELFNMYDFDSSKPEQEDFFNFKISARLATGESQQEWKPKQDIVVILTKLHGKIIEPYMKGLTAKLQNYKAIIISIVSDNPLDFSYDTDKICLIDKELLECLLYYSIDVIKLGSPTGEHGVYGVIRKKEKV